MVIPRYLFAQDFAFEQVANDLHAKNLLAPVRRFVRLDPSTIWVADAHETDTHLGRALERVLALGATSIVIDAAVPGADGKLSAVWFPNHYLPMRADILSRFAWQMHSRAGVTIFGRLSVKAALNTLKDPERVLGLFRDFGAAAQLDGLLLEDTPQLVGMKGPDVPGAEALWEVKKRRDGVDDTVLNGLDALALRCFRILEAARPRLSLALLTSDQTLPGPSSIAAVTFIATPDNRTQATSLLDRLKAVKGKQPLFPRSLGVWIEGSKPPSSADLVAITRMFQRSGISVIGWADDMIGDKPPAAQVAGSVSASSFPVRF